MQHIQPSNEAEAAAAIADAHGARTPLEIVGGGTKRGVGRPINASATLSAEKLSGIVAYEPTELVITARAGTPMAEIEAELARNNRMLAFEPADWRALTSTDGTPTIGAVAATNMSGPRRFVAGAARDSLLGVRLVNGTGEIIKNGGRVMKNVTGLDLVKLMAGSWGTLGFLTEVTFKVLPVAETEATLVLTGLDEQAGVTALARAMATHTEVSGAAHLPFLTADSLLGGRFRGDAVTALRLAGLENSVNVRLDFLKKHLGGNQVVLNAVDSRALWLDIRDVRPFAAPDARPVWKVSMAPDSAWRMVDALRRIAGVAAFYDWQGGLAWLRMEADTEAHAVRTAIRACGGGHATLVRADMAARSAVEPFEPLSKPVAALQARVKAAFDPAGILNPGRMGF